jgi:hypothetical protein
MKSFISGFESIFGVSAEEIEMGIAEEQLDVVLPLGNDQKAITDSNAPPKPNRQVRRVRNIAKTEIKSVSKNFTSDLESLFRDALTSSFEEEFFAEEEAFSIQPEINNKPIERKASPEDQDTRPRRRISTPGGGLDMLFRETTDETILEYETDKKRVTFVFDKEKLQKLKRIARERQLFLKDVVGEVVAKFIQEYESSHGEVNLD